MKKRTITLMLSLLAVALLVGVGFATWVISQGAKTESTGNIIVEAVSDDRLDMVVTPSDPKDENPVTSKYSIIFGHPATMSGSNLWLTSNGTSADQEKLTQEFTVTITKHGGGAFTDSSKPVVTASLLAAAVDEKLIALNGDTVETVKTAFQISEVTLSGDKKTATCTVTLKLNWGSVFGNQNPFSFFNTGHKAEDSIGDDYDAEGIAELNTALGLSGANVLTATSTYGDFAYAALHKLESLNEAAIKVTINASLTPAA